MRTPLAILLIASLAALGGCSDSSTDAPDLPKSASGPTEASLPAELFASTAPSDSVALIDAKSAASAGERVVFEARVGGRVEPFVEGRAVFFVADPSLVSCAEMGPDDHCKTPWDYCCEPPANLTKHMATVQVVDDAGQPLKASLRGQHGLAPLKTIVVAGTVHQVDAEGNFVVNAETIHVR